LPRWSVSQRIQEYFKLNVEEHTYKKSLKYHLSMQINILIVNIFKFGYAMGARIPKGMVVPFKFVNINHQRIFKLWSSYKNMTAWSTQTLVWVMVCLPGGSPSRSKVFFFLNFLKTGR
jgi:hypothetical protein